MDVLSRAVGGVDAVEVRLDLISAVYYSACFLLLLEVYGCHTVGRMGSGTSCTPPSSAMAGARPLRRIGCHSWPARKSVLVF